jgi:hypothetical protein
MRDTLILVFALIITIAPDIFDNTAQAKDKTPPTGFALSVGQLSSIGQSGELGEILLHNIGTRIGYRIGRIQPFLLIDYTNISNSNEISPPMSTSPYGGGNETLSRQQSMSLFTVGTGLKWLLNEPKSKSIQTYLLGSVYTIIATSELDMPQPEIADPTIIGGTSAFGMQYAFTRHFSAGLELGISYTNVFIDKYTGKSNTDFIHLYDMLFLEFVL